MKKKTEDITAKIASLPDVKVGRHVKWNAEKDAAILQYKDAKGIKAIARILGVAPETVSKRYADLKAARK